MGADRTASSGKTRRSGPAGSGQPAFPGGGSVDRACRGAVARPSRGLRELELGLPEVPPLGQKRRVRQDLPSLGARRRLRVRDHRWNHRPGAPARHRRKGGTQAQAIGRSRGGLTTKIVALVDALGNLVRFVLLPGQRHDSVGVAPLLKDLDFAVLLADKAFDSDAIRADLDARGATAVIPPKANRVTTIPCDSEMYKWRHLVENFFCKVKEQQFSI